MMVTSSGVHGADTELLFNGKSLDNWTTQHGKPITRGWEVVDGMIHLQPTQPRAGHIVTKQEFGDFRLSFEWKIPAGGNSGLKYRVRDYGGKTRGCEYQIIDDTGYHKLVEPRNSSGALYDLVAPNQNKKLLPLDQFNSSKIRVEDNQVTHWLNGQEILTIRIGSPNWHRRVAESKFSDLTNFAINPRGKILLTDHNGEIWFRNFEFQLLPMDESASK
ncbi:MAG: 3-keto-disaccharide hydrolase [Bythopirellula sp.]